MRHKLCFSLVLTGFVFWTAVKVWGGAYTSSIHGDVTSGVMRDAIYNIYTAISRGNCLHCHEMHASVDGSEPNPQGGPQPYTLFAFEEEVCFYCHTSSTNTGQVNPPAGFKDLKGLFTNSQNIYRHPVTDYSGRHRKPAFKETAADLQPPNRHSECVDCHNPHVVQADTHTPPTNAVSGVLRGVFGVEPNWSNQNWTVPIAPQDFTELRPDKNNPAGGAQKEYQICLKCHSYYGFGTAEDTTTGVTTITGPSGVSLTDQALEFSPYNYSGHPVAVAANSRQGGYSPWALDANRMKSPWDTNVGQQTMYCSDCHGEDASTEIKGPHASDAKFMLVDGRTWPKKPTSTEANDNTCNGDYWTLGDIANNRCSWSTRLLCAKCHKICDDGNTCSGRSGFYNNVHSDIDHYSETYTINGVTYDTIPCVSCHMAVPHGSHASRLIVYTSDPAPYNAEGAMATLEGFCKASTSTSYGKGNCYSTHPACSEHSIIRSGVCTNNSYDP